MRLPVPPRSHERDLLRHSTARLNERRQPRAPTPPDPHTSAEASSFRTRTPPLQVVAVEHESQADSTCRPSCASHSRASSLPDESIISSNSGTRTRANTSRARLRSRVFSPGPQHDDQRMRERRNVLPGQSGQLLLGGRDARGLERLGLRATLSETPLGNCSEDEIHEPEQPFEAREKPGKGKQPSGRTTPLARSPSIVLRERKNSQQVLSEDQLGVMRAHPELVQRLRLIFENRLMPPAREK